MNWIPDKSRPICPQICESICVAVANGEFAAGDRLLSVREVALLAGVNPNTVQKSFEELERRGVIHSVRCSGWYVNENTEAAAHEVEKLRKQKTAEYLAAMSQLGCGLDEIIQHLHDMKEEQHE
jgi:DNA-binding transcriptional regulator YhcF (GntR family)